MVGDMWQQRTVEQYQPLTKTEQCQNPDHKQNQHQPKALAQTSDRICGMVKTNREGGNYGRRHDRKETCKQIISKHLPHAGRVRKPNSPPAQFEFRGTKCVIYDILSFNMPTPCDNRNPEDQDEFGCPMSPVQ